MISDSNSRSMRNQREHDNGLTMKLRLSKGHSCDGCGQRLATEKEIRAHRRMCEDIDLVRKGILKPFPIRELAHPERAKRSNTIQPARIDKTASEEVLPPLKLKFKTKNKVFKKDPLPGLRKSSKPSPTVQQAPIKTIIKKTAKPSVTLHATPLDNVEIPELTSLSTEMPQYRYICAGCGKNDFVSAQSIAGHAAACQKYQTKKNLNPNRPPKNKKVKVTKEWWQLHQQKMGQKGLNAFHPSSKASRALFRPPMATSKDEIAESKSLSQDTDEEFDYHAKGINMHEINQIDDATISTSFELMSEDDMEVGDSCESSSTAEQSQVIFSYTLSTNPLSGERKSTFEQLIKSQLNAELTWSTCFPLFRECPMCAKKIKSRSFTNHIKFDHNTDDNSLTKF